MCVCVSAPCMVSVGVFTLEGGAGEAVLSRQRQRAHLCVSLLRVLKVCVCVAGRLQSLNKLRANEQKCLSLIQRTCCNNTLRFLYKLL